MAKKLLTDEEILRSVEEALLNPASVKVRTTINLDADVKDFFRGLAAQSNSKYQTLINETLRSVMMAHEGQRESSGSSERLGKKVILDLVDCVEQLAKGRKIPQKKIEALKKLVG